jgi:hypothetical protein
VDGADQCTELLTGEVLDLVDREEQASVPRVRRFAGRDEEGGHVLVKQTGIRATEHGVNVERYRRAVGQCVRKRLEDAEGALDGGRNGAPVQF